jgi:hypothetical protein
MSDDLDRELDRLAEKLPRWARQTLAWVRKPSSGWVRYPLALVLIGGGIVGFLPILGFWMIPVGVALIALDIPPLRRRLLAWVRRHRKSDDRGNAIRPQTRTHEKPDASGR